MILQIYQTYRAAYRGLPRTAWRLAAVVLVNRSGSMVLFFMTLYLTSQKGYTVAEAGRMISVYGLGALLGAWLGGWMTDYIGAKQMQLASLTLSGITFIILAYMSGPLAIAITLFILATINEAFRPASVTAFSQVSHPKLRTRVFGLNRLAVNLGVAIGPAIGGFLATVDYHLLFWVDGLTCLSAALFLAITIPAKEINSPVIDYGSAPMVINPWRDKVYLLLLVILLYLFIVFVQIFNTWPLFLREYHGYPENKIGLLLALNAIMIVLFEMPLIHRIENKNPLVIMAIGSFVLLLGFGLTPLNPTYAFLMITVALWTVGEMLVFPIATSFIANRANDRNRGKYMGMYTFTFALAFVIGPTIGAQVYDTLGPVVLWIGAGSIGILVLYLFRMINAMLEK